MTILSENLKTIRKSLNCTQMALSEVLDIGFRTYVRYEAGERDAPVAVLVKLGKLGSISLDRLLTTKITPEDLANPDLDAPSAKSSKLEVIGGSLERGRVVFKGLRDDFFITTDNSEKKLLSTFRKMDPLKKDKCLLEIEWLLKNSKKSKKMGKRKVSKKQFQVKNTSALKKIAGTIQKITLKG